MKVFTPLQRIWMLGIQLGCLVLTFFATQLCKAQELNAPLSTSNAYDFTGLTVGNPVELPDSWFILNPQQGEEESSFSVKGDDNGSSYLGFEGNTLSETTFMCFKIGKTENGTYTPYSLAPKESNYVFPREILLSMRFTPTSRQQIDVIRKLYRTADDRIQMKTPLAAKLGVYVGEDDYFYVARVKAAATIDDPNEYVWIKSPISYRDVGSGRVDVKIESYTYRASGHEDIVPEGTTAYAIYVRKYSNPESDDWLCLTEGLGYTWEMDSTSGGYRMDFKSIDNEEISKAARKWLYAIDATEFEADTTAFTSWNAIGFSADAGGLYSAQIKEREKIVTLQSLSLTSLNVGGFESFLDLSSPNYTLFADWVSRYNVDLTENLSAKTTLRSMALSNGLELTEKTFNAFLLDMDPTLGEQQKLYVKAIAPKAHKMVLTIEGPASSNLSNATKRAGRLYISRATTIATLATADYVALDQIPNASIGYEGGSVIVTLPRTNDNDEEMPFVKVELRAVE